MSMPFMDGVALVRAIRKMKPATMFIASTGQGEETHVAELQSLGVSNFLTKPYGTEKLLKTVRDTLTANPQILPGEPDAYGKIDNVRSELLPL
jgi:CheY-like chemotaxis protein